MSRSFLLSNGTCTHTHIDEHIFMCMSFLKFVPKMVLLLVDHLK